jgi:hypothetical protein
MKKFLLGLILLVMMAIGSSAGIQDGLVGWWKMDGNARDSASTNNGVWVGTESYTTRQYNVAGSFNGITNYVNCGDPVNGSLDFGISNFTISAWIKPTNLAGLHKVIGKHNAYPYWYLAMRDNKSQLEFAFSSTNTITLNGLQSFSLNSWSLMTVTVNRNGNMTLYRNGVKDSEVAMQYASQSMTSANKLYIGATEWIPNYFTGGMDDVRIYNRALPPDEIALLYQDGNYTNSTTRDRDLKTEWYGRTITGVQAVGGIITNYTENGTNFTAHIFTTNGTFSVAKGGQVEALVVAGGGGGGGSNGGGGGGENTNAFPTIGSSGGGGNGYTVTTMKGTNGVIGLGNSGGNGLNSGSGIYSGGGGGGYSSSGSNAVYAIRGSGGSGLSSTYSGVYQTYAGGGGGGGVNSSGGIGIDGGGNGSGTNTVLGQSAPANRGGGGGGGGNNTAGGSGGSGIVIIRYPTQKNVDLLFTSTGYGTNVHWQAPFITAPTLTDYQVKWIAPNGSITNSKTPSAIFFTNAGTYRISLRDWSKVTRLSFYAEGYTTRNYLSGMPNSTQISKKMTGITSAEAMFMYQTIYDMSQWDISQWKNNRSLYQTWFGCRGLTTCPDVSEMTNNASLFQTWADCRTMTNTPDVSKMTKPTDLNSAWNNCFTMGTAPVVSQMVNVVAAGLRYTWIACTAMTNSSDISTMRNVADLTGTWQDCWKMTNAPNVSGLSNITTLVDTWHECNSMTGTPDLVSATKVTTLRNTWLDCFVMKEAPVISNMLSLNTMYYTFANNYTLTNAPFINTLTNVSDMTYALYNCNKIKNLPDIFNLTNVTSLSSTFDTCTSATNRIPDISALTKCTSLGNTFYNDANLVGDIPDISGMTNCTYLFSTFWGCTKISNNIPDISKLPKNISLYGTFFNCQNITGNIPDISTMTNCQNMYRAFSSCGKLTGNIPDFTTMGTNLVNISQAFLGCVKLEGDIPNFTNMVNLIDLRSIFDGVVNVTGQIPDLSHFPKNLYFDRIAYNCSKLTSNADIVFSDTNGFTALRSSANAFYNNVSMTGNGMRFVTARKSALYTVGTASTNSSYRTFYSCTNLTDYKEIPEEYGGAFGTTNGILGWWKLDEGLWNGTAGEVIDYVGGRNGSSSNGAYITNGLIQNAGYFQETNSYLNFGGILSFTGRAPCTVMAWINATNIQAGTSGVLARGLNHYILAFLGGDIQFWRYASGWTHVDFGSNIQTGSWYHVAGSYDGTNLNVYLNGTKGSTSTSSTVNWSVGSGTTNFLVGNYGGINQNFSGRIDEVRVYGRSLTSTEILQLYNKYK